MCLQLNSKLLGEGGPIDEDQDSGDETNYNAISIPGAKRGDDGSRKSRVEVLTSQVSFSSTGREWAAVSGEGLHIYSLDDDMVFDPIFLAEDFTPAAIEAKMCLGDYGGAIRMAVSLNEFDLVKKVIERTPLQSISQVIRAFGVQHLERLLQFIASGMENSPHLEFYIDWCLNVLQIHGRTVENDRPVFMRALRSLYKVIHNHQEELRPLCDSNQYVLAFIESQADVLHS